MGPRLSFEGREYGTVETSCNAPDATCVPFAVGYHDRGKWPVTSGRDAMPLRVPEFGFFDYPVMSC